MRAGDAKGGRGGKGGKFILNRMRRKLKRWGQSVFFLSI